MQSDAKSAEILLRAKPFMISNVAAAGRAPWMVVTTIFAGAAISEIGKNYPNEMSGLRYQNDAHHRVFHCAEEV